ncbi:hypothetical protein BX666DRAFT_1958282, partial [Dichotomocladium elegans]
MNDTIEWVYNAGSSWAPLDSYTQQTIEVLWSQNGATWIQSSPSFGGNSIFIDTSQLILTCSGHSFHIARRCKRKPSRY